MLNRRISLLAGAAAVIAAAAARSAWVPIIGLAFFLVLGVVARSWIHLRRYGSSGIAALHDGPWPVRLATALAPLPILVLLAEGALQLWEPHSLDALRPVAHFDSVLVRRVGAALLFAGTVLMFGAQLEMGPSWRIGIDEHARPGLVTTGIYAISRNPIYVFLFAALVGAALLLPTWLSLATVAATVVAFRSAVVHFEERFLEDAYGEEFRAYARRVGRFVPGVGLLS